MLEYYLRLSLHSLGQTKKTTLLIVLAMAFGIGSSLTAWSLVRALSGNPLPDHTNIHYVRLNAVPASYVGQGPDPSNDTTYPDAQQVLRRIHGVPQAAVASTTVLLHRNDTQGKYQFVNGHMVTPAFFRVFGVPIKFGHAWSHADAQARARLIVLSSELATRVFGTSAGAIGKIVVIDDQQFTVSGVFSGWSVTPNVYSDIGTPAFGKPDDFFIPLSTATASGIQPTTNRGCWQAVALNKGLTSEGCSWLQLWASLKDGAATQRYTTQLRHYVQSVRSPGHFDNDDSVRVFTLPQWLSYRKAIPGDITVESWFALGFLLICIVNSSGLILVKFTRKSREVAIRRAVGASRRSVFAQLTTEVIVLSLCGGIVGLGGAALGLEIVRGSAGAFAKYVRIDVPMLGYALALSLLVGFATALLPAFRAARAQPGVLVKRG